MGSDRAEVPRMPTPKIDAGVRLVGRCRRRRAAGARVVGGGEEGSSQSDRGEGLIREKG